MEACGIPIDILAPMLQQSPFPDIPALSVSSLSIRSDPMLRRNNFFGTAVVSSSNATNILRISENLLN